MDVGAVNIKGDAAATNDCVDTVGMAVAIDTAGMDDGDTADTNDEDNADSKDVVDTTDSNEGGDDSSRCG